MSYSKPIVFIDTNALSHISSLELNKQRVGNWLWKHFDVKTCTAVKNEFNKNVNKADGHQKSMSRKLGQDRNLIPRSRHLSRLETNWLANHYYLKSLNKHDEGERHLICTALEQLVNKKTSHFFIVTDDNTARKYFLDAIESDFPFGAIWSTPDLILYMYLAFNNVQYEFGESSLIDITSQDSFGFKQFLDRDRGDTEADARIKMRKHYLDRLNRIRFLRTNAI